MDMCVDTRSKSWRFGGQMAFMAVDVRVYRASMGCMGWEKQAGGEYGHGLLQISRL